MGDRVGTLTRAALSEALEARAGVTARKADRLVDGIIARISEALESGEQVKITGFGTFLLHEKAARAGRNPRTGKEHVVTARRVIGFRPSAGLRARVSPPLKQGDRST
ncbi:integration host factor subunit alpha [Sphingobium sp.]|uniref:integration host factor subunit alpha n=1 Tax=Sphingobium sp. TaxID=1912891 RepID=UPI002CA42B30|nr:integration host factor subunit alpha [Sphingobium sp.]HUD89954.1 integration host factor subunit alpha [Sphingobium sp.]